MGFPLILASGSPRREQLLKQLGLHFRIVIPRVDETMDLGIDPREGTAIIAERKARSVAENYPQETVLAADTIVVLGDRRLGKPGSAAEAVEMLLALEGREHQVSTGLSLMRLSEGLNLSGAATTRVWMASMDRETIEAYVETGEPMDKAGAYAIQGKGAALVDRIEGCYSNVVGLPLSLLTRLLREAGLDVWKIKS